MKIIFATAAAADELKLAEQRAYYMTIFAAALIVVVIIMTFLFIRNSRLKGKLKEIASKDSLTEIYNRRYFMELGEIQIARALRNEKNCFIVVYDLDYFKAINDKYGHHAGDTVLKETVSRVKHAIRPYDLFARYGGEEFVILLADIDKGDVINVIERIRQTICKEPVDFEGNLISVSASFGVACATASADLDKSIRQADEALYKAKESGRNKVVLYENEEEA